MRILSSIICVSLLALGPALASGQNDTPGPGSTSISCLVPTPLPAPMPATQPAAQTSSVMVYIKVVVDKKYGFMARLFGGMQDNIWERTNYVTDNPWWLNPLIVHNDVALPEPDLTASADALMITGQGSSDNIQVKVTLVPHADIAVKTTPRSDGIKGTITTTISTLAKYYDGGWVPMVHEKGRQVTFAFDTCDPREQLEEIGRETRVIPQISFERYIREEQKWEPKLAWPMTGKRGDWNVAIYCKNATLTLINYRYVKQATTQPSKQGDKDVAKADDP